MMLSILGQGQARHRWFHAVSDTRLVEILERPSGGSRSGGRALKDIFQIMIVIFVQSADGHSFLRAFQLTADGALPGAKQLRHRTADSRSQRDGARRLR